jgi:DNA-binding NarL/FixJ family response regulator
VGTRRIPRIAVVTMGHAPRPDVMDEIRPLLGEATLDEFGALDNDSEDLIAKSAPCHDELSYLTRLRDGRHVIVEAGFVTSRTEALVTELDGQNFDLIILAMTGMRARLATRTPLIHGQDALDAWISALTASNSRIGIIFPLASQQSAASESDYGTMLKSSLASIGGSQSSDLTQAIDRVSGADLIVMNSVGYTSGMAQQVERSSGRPVVTACRIIGSTARLRLSEIAGKPLDLQATTYTGAELLRRLPQAALDSLTRRETEVLVQVLEGAANKFIGRTLGISHRTVEIHRSRAMVKLGASSTPELIRRALRQPNR